MLAPAMTKTVDFFICYNYSSLRFSSQKLILRIECVCDCANDKICVCIWSSKERIHLCNITYNILIVDGYRLFTWKIYSNCRSIIVKIFCSDATISRKKRKRVFATYAMKLNTNIYLNWYNNRIFRFMYCFEVNVIYRIMQVAFIYLLI